MGFFNNKAMLFSSTIRKSWYNHNYTHITGRLPGALLLFWGGGRFRSLCIGFTKEVHYYKYIYTLWLLFHGGGKFIYTLHIFHFTDQLHLYTFLHIDEKNVRIAVKNAHYLMFLRTLGSAANNGGLLKLGRLGPMEFPASIQVQGARLLGSFASLLHQLQISWWLTSARFQLGSW